MKRLLIGIILVASLGLAYAPAAWAHVLITDSTGKQGAILHVDPDDDPVAGQPATLYLDTQGLQGTATLEVQQGSSTQMLTMHASTTIHDVRYTFPYQGVYYLTFRIHTAHTTYIFRQAQLVSEGPAESNVPSHGYEWARGLLILAGVSFGGLLIVVYNRWPSISKQSRYNKQ